MGRLAARASLLAVGVLFCNEPALATPDTPASLLKQYTSRGHVLGFDEGGYYVSNGTYALRVTFEDAAAVAPSADDAAAETSDQQQAAPLARVTYSGLWKGIGVTYDAPGSGIARSTWTVEPGADPGAIRLRYSRAVKISESGELGIGVDTGALSESRPVAWQDVDGERRSVDVAFVRLEDDVVGFEVGTYRADLPLTIDPTLTWNTFLGGGGSEEGLAIAVDGSGDVYVAGSTSAVSWGSPIRAYTAGTDAFVAKLTSTGALTWNTFLGGNGSDIGTAIAVDGAGNVYVAGFSNATWGTPLSAYTSFQDAFVAKLASTGALTWNTFLSASSNDDRALAIATGGGGNVYVTGFSRGTWGIPVRPYTASNDAFVAELTSAGALSWNTFIGGTADDVGYAIAVDPSGNVSVAGRSDGTWGSPQRAYTSGGDAFVARLTFAGALTWNTFLGGSGTDLANSIAADASGDLYVAGSSAATWASPVRAYTSAQDTFAAKLTSAGALAWNTFLGGSGSDTGNAIAVDGSGNVYAAGFSDVTWGSPVHPHVLFDDAFAAKLTSAGALTWNTFIGGDSVDYGYAAAVGISGNVYVTGRSNDTWGSPLRSFTSGGDAFLAQIDDALPTATPTSTPIPTSTATPPCGNASVDAGEDCDDGNVLNGDCCSATCQYEANGSACASDGNVCTDDVCDGSGSCGVANSASCDDGLFCNGSDTCSGGSCAHSGNPCSGGAECSNFCNEAMDNCFASGGTACTSDSNPCTLDQCNGGGSCIHPAGNAGTVCRGTAGPCDIAEQCNGTSTTCPVDAFAASGTCRGAAGECDLAESCNGGGAHCPADVFNSAGTGCTSDGDPCTVDECSGSAASCVHGDADADGVGDLCDNCVSAANPDQQNSDCSDPNYFLTVGCAAPPSNKAGCCDGGDVCDACPAQNDNASCDPQGTAGTSVGPAGGSLVTASGAVSVTIPPGTLSANTSITVTENGPATRFTLDSTAVFSASMRPENLQFAAPVTITFTWADRDSDGLVDRGTCVGGVDNGQSCDHDADCAANDCTSNTNTNETAMVLKRNAARFSKGGFAASPYKCSDHLSGTCSTAVPNCSHLPGTGQATVANCCIPGSNTWTFKTCSFSEFFLGLTAGDLVPGRGSAVTDCTSEWGIRNPMNAPFSDSSGLPNFKQTCMDGDPSCDTDGLANGICAIEVSVCLNVEDPRLVDDTGAPACTSGSVDQWVLKKPKPDSTKPAEATNSVAIRDAVAALTASSIGGTHQEVVTFTTPVNTGDECTAPIVIQVPLKGPTKKGKAVLKMQSIGGSVRDSDKLKITCLPSDALP